MGEDRSVFRWSSMNPKVGDYLIRKDPTDGPDVMRFLKKDLDAYVFVQITEFRLYKAGELCYFNHEDLLEAYRYLSEEDDLDQLKAESL